MSQIPLDEIKANGEPGVTFGQMLASDPCHDCPSPCCRMVLLSQRPATTFLEMDHFRYVLGFMATQLIITQEGNWYIGVLDDCRFLDTETNLCTVHGTDRKPLVCRNFNQYQCWYKRNFTTGSPPDAVRFDSDLFEKLLELVSFDEDGRVTGGLAWETLQALALPFQAPIGLLA